MIESIVKIWAKYDYVFLNGLWGTLWLAFVTVLFGTILGSFYLRFDDLRFTINITLLYIYSFYLRFDDSNFLC